MIYTMFLYRTGTNIPLYEKDMQYMSDEKLDMFSAFYSALKSFISGLVLEGSKELKSLELGEYGVTISHVSKVALEIVIIADKEDTKEINKIIPSVIRIILEHEELFINSKPDPRQFEMFDQKMNDFLFSNKSLIGQSFFIEKQGMVSAEIWAPKGEMVSQIEKEQEEQKKRLKLQRDELMTQYGNEYNIIKKYEYTKQIIELSQLLEDDETSNTYQEEERRLNDEIKDVKLKLQYYLSSMKKALKEALNPLSDTYGQFKEVYMHFYSFSTKLKNVTSKTVYQQYIALARSLSDLSEIDEFSPIIGEIERIPDDIEKFLK